MEVRSWTYEEFPEFTAVPEGARVIETTGEETGVNYFHDVEYARIGDTPLRLHLVKGADHGGPEFWTDQVLDIVDRFCRDCFSRA